MDAEGILFCAERGFHPIFDDGVIAEAFEQDPALLRELAAHRRTDVELVLTQLLASADPGEARGFIGSLPRELQHVLVLLYFELVDGRLGDHATLH